MTLKLVPLAAAAALIGGSAGADPFVDAVVRNFQDMGYQFVEVERGATQLKAEGVRGTEELEVVYDLATGRILKQEKGRADAEYVGRTGVEIDVSRNDFVGDDSDDDDSRSGRDDDDDDDDSRSGRDDDDDDDSRGGDDDDDSRDRDRDRSGSDDDGSSRSGGEDNGGSRSGSDDRGGDDNDDDRDDDRDDD